MEYGAATGLNGFTLLPFLKKRPAHAWRMPTRREWRIGTRVVYGGRIREPGAASCSSRT